MGRVAAPDPTFEKIDIRTAGRSRAWAPGARLRPKLACHGNLAEPLVVILQGPSPESLRRARRDGRLATVIVTLDVASEREISLPSSSLAPRTPSPCRKGALERPTRRTLRFKRTRSPAARLDACPANGRADVARGPCLGRAYALRSPHADTVPTPGDAMKFHTLRAPHAVRAPGSDPALPAVRADRGPFSRNSVSRLTDSER